MAKEGFDFKAFKELKLTEYKKQYARTLIVKKAKAALILHKYDLNGKKKQTLIVPFKKMPEAVVAYKAIKADKKIHYVKWTSLVKVEQGKGEVTLEIKKGGLLAEDIQNGLQELFDKTIMLGLNVTGISDDKAEEGDLEGDKNSDGVLDAVIDDSTINELKKEFQAAQKLYKESKTLDKAAKTKAIEQVSKMFSALMPKLENFINLSTNKAQLSTANKIKESIDKFQSALNQNTTAKTEVSNVKLQELTGGIKNKAAQLLKDYPDEISKIKELNDQLQSISQMA